MFVCPIAGTAADAFSGHVLVHLGLTGFIVAAGLVFLVLAMRAYVGSAPARPVRRPPATRRGSLPEPPRV